MYKINKSSNNLHTDEFHIYYFMKFKKYKHLNQPNNYIVKNKICIETLNFFIEFPILLLKSVTFDL